VLQVDKVRLHLIPFVRSTYRNLFILFSVLRPSSDFKAKTLLDP